MKQIIKINGVGPHYVNDLYNNITSLQINTGFTPLNFEFVSENETISFEGLITDLLPLGETRFEFEVMYEYISMDKKESVIDNSLNVYFIKDEFHCNFLRGFKRIVVSEDEIESLQEKEPCEICVDRDCDNCGCD